MKANAVPLLALFEKKMRLEVPLFQRQYVWSREAQWEPLWEDIERKFLDYLNGRREAPVHFLGAMVLDQKQTPATHVEKRQVIDGQQRLTTLQIFLSALRDFCRVQGCEDLARELDGYTLNKGLMANPDVDKFKVWPTKLDREHFCDVVALGSRTAVEAKYPQRRQRYARKPDPRPRMVEAYLFFNDQVQEFFLSRDAEHAAYAAADQPLSGRIEEAFQALKNALQVVVIDLERDDDAQVIFETLNARGEPLLPADLLRNYIFLRASRLNEPQEDLYAQYWAGFDSEFWREEVRQGRLVRPRSDLFMQHFLSSRQMMDIPIKHLFVEYKFWIDRVRPFPSVTSELAALARQREHFRRLVQPQRGDVVFELATFLESLDIRTGYPLLLFLFDVGLSEAEWRSMSSILESYLLRRAVLGRTTKAYNRIFLGLVRSLRASNPTAESLHMALSALSGESSAWPTDAEFSNAWMSANAYELNNSRVVHILRRVSEEHLGRLSERISIESPLTVEHILPQSWVEHWPLPGGEVGMTATEIWDAQPEDPRVVASTRRNLLVQTIGNLTLVTQGLNSSVSNASWEVKKPAILQSSLLPINQQLHEHGVWNEDSIERRGRELLKRALNIWVGPKV